MRTQRTGRATPGSWFSRRSAWGRPLIFEHVERPAGRQVLRIVRHVAVEARADLAARVLRLVDDARALVDRARLVREPAGGTDRLGERELVRLTVDRRLEQVAVALGEAHRRRAGVRPADRLLAGDPAPVAERRPAGAVDDRAVQATRSPRPARGGARRRSGSSSRPRPCRRTPCCGRRAARRWDAHGIAILAVADQPHEVLGALAVEAAAGERAHAVERERRRVPVATSSCRCGRTSRRRSPTGSASTSTPRWSGVRRSSPYGRAAPGAAFARARCARPCAPARVALSSPPPSGGAARQERPPVESGMHP